MLIEKIPIADKIFSRLSKEENLFLSKEYKKIVKFFKKHHTYVFYGIVDISFRDEKKETKFFKLQLDFLKTLIEKGLLSYYDCEVILDDTLIRYSIPQGYTAYKEKWINISLNSGKKEFVDFFFKKCDEYGFYIDNEKKKEIISGLPR